MKGNKMNEYTAFRCDRCGEANAEAPESVRIINSDGTEKIEQWCRSKCIFNVFGLAPVREKIASEFREKYGEIEGSGA
jgi:hypothetical protein